MIIDPDAGHFTTTSQPERILAESAADLLMAPEKWHRGTPEKDHHWWITIEAMSSPVDTGLIDEDRTAELVSGMLRVMARDFQSSEAPDDHRDTHPKFAQSFGVVGYLSTLLLSPELLLDQPADTSRKGNTIRTDFAGARMNFTHWVSTQTLLQADGLRSLLQMLVHAQAAMRLASNQGTRDLLIPVHLGKSSEPPVPQKLTAVMIKVRNQRTSSVFSVSDKAYVVFLRICRPSR